MNKELVVTDSIGTRYHKDIKAYSMIKELRVINKF